MLSSERPWARNAIPTCGCSSRQYPHVAAPPRVRPWSAIDHGGSPSSLNLRNPSGHQLRDLSAKQLWLCVRIRPASYRRLRGLMADVGARPVCSRSLPISCSLTMLTLARLSSYQCRYCFLTSDVVRPLNLMVSILAMSSSPVHCQDLNSHLRKRPRSIGAIILWYSHAGRGFSLTLTQDSV